MFASRPYSKCNKSSSARHDTLSGLFQCIESNIYDTIRTICAMGRWKLNHTFSSYVASCNKGVLHSVWSSTPTWPHSQAMWEGRKWSGIDCLRMHDHSYFCKIVSFTLSVYMDQLAGHTCIGTDFTDHLPTYMDFQFVLGMGSNAQAVDTRPLSILPCDLGMRLLQLIKINLWLQYMWPISVRAIVTVR